MLNQNILLNYIKTNLGFPYQFIEYTDQQIMDYVTNFSVYEFSHYFPDKTIIALNTTYERNRVPFKQNEFYIWDEQGLEILGVKDIYPDQGNYMLFGHPPYGPFSLGEMGQWALSVEIAGWLGKMSGISDYTFEFNPPNIIRISPNPNTEQYIAIEYERVHHPSLTTIGADLRQYFMDLCLGDIQMQLGRIRTKYGDQNIQTPFGAIPLNGSQLFEEGKTRKDSVLDKLTAGALPNVVFARG